MGTVNVVLGEDTRLNLILGQQLENAVTSVVFDFSAWQTTYGAGTLALSVQRPGDEMPYAATLTISGTNATWSVTNLDTAYKGVGHIQLTYTVGSAIKKSVVYKFTVYESLGANGEYPSPGQTWQEEMEQEITDVKSDLQDLQAEIEGGGSGLTAQVKEALLSCFRHIAFLDDEEDYYQNLYDALYSVVVTSIRLNTNTLSFGILNSTQQLTAITTPVGGAVAWVSSDPSVVTVSNTGLVTSIGYGSATITATSGSASATCSVEVVQAQLTSISAVYTQTGIVYNTDSLDSLKSDLVVTASWDNGTTSTVASSDYTLSGTLTVGTSTITVTYGGKTATFDVTVTKGIDYTEDALAGATWNNGYGYGTSTGVLTTRSGAYATDKFTVQDLSYSVRNLDTSNNTNFYIFVWDENDTYLGNKQYSDARFQWKPEYKIAIEVRNSGTFDPSTITMLPVDKRETAVNEFEIDLASVASSVVKANGYYELDVKTIMNEHGVTSANYSDTLNRQSIIGMINQAVTTNNFPFKAPIRIGTFNYGTTMLLSIFVEGITVSDANLSTLQQYLIDNNVKIRYNY